MTPEHSPDLDIREIGLHPAVRALHGFQLDWKGSDEQRTVHTTASVEFQRQFAYLLAVADERGITIEVLESISDEKRSIRGDVDAALTAYREVHGISIIEYPIK